MVNWVIVRLFVSSVLASAAAVGQESALDLHRTLAAAEAANLELRAARQQRAVAMAGVRIAGQIPNPIVSFNASRDAPHESLLWDQPIELGGKRGKRRAVAQAEQQTTEIDIAILSRQIRHRTREAFYRALLARAQAGQSKTTLDLATRIANIIRQRFEGGDVAQLEVIQAEVEAERATADYDTALQAQKIADAQLAALLNRSLDQTWNLEGRLDELPKAETLQAVTDRALGSNADILRTTQELETYARMRGATRDARDLWRWLGRSAFPMSISRREWI